MVWLIVVGSYLLGAIPFGYLVARAVRGIDIREHGSRNIGATNVGRVLGLKWFFVVFLLDFLKAAIPVGLLAYGGLPSLVPEGWPATGMAALAGLAILLGNMFPVYLGFRGGKGAATGTGVMLPLAPVPLMVALAVFLVTFQITRYVSLGSILASLALVLTQLAVHGAQVWQSGAGLWAGNAWPVTVLCLVGAGLVIFRHRSNMVRLWQGTENQIPRRTSRVEAKACTLRHRWHRLPGYRNIP